MKEFWKDYYAWLDRARIGEIFAARDRAYEYLRRVKDRDVKLDLRRMVRLMDEELLTRSDLVRVLGQDAK